LVSEVHEKRLLGVRHTPIRALGPFHDSDEGSKITLPIGLPVVGAQGTGSTLTLSPHASLRRRYHTPNTLTFIMACRTRGSAIWFATTIHQHGALDFEWTNEFSPGPWSLCTEAHGAIGSERL